MLRAQMVHVFAVTALLVASSPVFAQTATASKVISDQILPKDTYFYLSVPDVAALKAHMSNSSAGQLFADPSLDAFKAEVMAAFRDKLDEGLTTIHETLGVTVEEFLNIPGGEISIAVSAAPGNAMGLIIFVDYGDHEDQVVGMLNKATDALSQIPKLAQEDENFDGTPITMFQIQYNGPAPTPLAKEFGWFTKDQRLVISNRSELLQSALTNWDGEDNNSFLSNEAYAYVMQRCQSGERKALSTMFFDPIGMFTKLVQTGSLGQQASMGAGMALGFLPTLGLSQLKAFGAVSEAGSGDFETVSRSVVVADQPPMGLMQIFQMDTTDQRPPAWV